LVCRLSIRGISTDAPIDSINTLFRTYGVADFLLFYQKVTIKELDYVIENGMFVVATNVAGIPWR